MEVMKYLWFLLLCIFALKEACADLKCEIQDDGELLECRNDNVNNLVLQRGSLSSYRNATTIKMNLCSITDIDNDAFDVPSLKSLDLSANYVENLPIGTFDELIELEELNLYNNYIKDLPVKIFKFNVNLKKLNLGDNVLFSLKVGVFDSLVNLTSLDLSSNYIAGNYWDPDVFRRNVNLINLHVSGNNMSEASEYLFHHFDKLISVNLMNCRLKEFPTFLISNNITNMIILNLQQNEIQTIEKNFLENYEMFSYRFI